MIYQGIEVTNTGLEMSSAFDTVNRKELLDKLKQVIDEDELRMSRLLLSDTTMTLRFNNHAEETFSSNKGSPQGDAISGVFFNVAFENALRDLRAELNKNITTIEHNYSKKSSLPVEMIYADDCDFTSEDRLKNQEILAKAKPILQNHDLIVNEDKWEITKIKRGKTKEEETEWRNMKKLGSLLGDYEDMKRRVQLSHATMKSVNSIWPNKKIHIKKRLKIYKTIVKSVLCYNMSTWGLTKKQTDEFDRAQHRKQLRIVWNDNYKRNKEVYKDSKENSMSQHMKEARWSAFGHNLRLSNKAPSQMAMNFYFEIQVKQKDFLQEREKLYQ